MHIKPSTLSPTIFETFPRGVRKPLSTGFKTNSPPTFQPRSVMASSTSSSAASHPSFDEYKIQSKIPSSSSSTPLNPQQSLVTASVLDLFAGFPSKRKLSLWTDDAAFVDPLTIATGRKQYEAQWYGLKAVMSDISAEKVEVVGNGNPIEVKTRMKYVVKGVGKEQVIDSNVLIHTDAKGEKITKVEDRWGGDVPPEGFFAKAMRQLNSVTVPAFVRVPASIEEEEVAEKK